MRYNFDAMIRKLKLGKVALTSVSPCEKKPLTAQFIGQQKPVGDIDSSRTVGEQESKGFSKLKIRQDYGNY